MQNPGVQSNLNAVLFLCFLMLFAVIEYVAHPIERGIGHYLKWGNHDRAQLGRLWEQDREKLAAQKKIQSILSGQNLKEATSDSIKTLKELFQSLNPTFPLLISREKFLELYFDFPGQWTRKIISPFELIEIDSNKSWRRVLLTRFGGWITLSFIDSQNFPIREVFLATNQIEEMQSTRTVQQGDLESAGFLSESVYPIHEFLQVLKTLDSDTQEALFPDPQWFLSKEFHITRVGVKADEEDITQPVQFGIEYEAEFFKNVLIIPVPREVANNMLSMIERSPQDGMIQPVLPFNGE